MEQKIRLKSMALIFLAASFLFWCIAFFFPILKSGYALGPFTLKKEYIFLHNSVTYFFEKGEIFIGLLLLFFTILFPFFKYVILWLIILGKISPGKTKWFPYLEMINKWAILDVLLWHYLFSTLNLILNLSYQMPKQAQLYSVCPFSLC